MIELSHGDCLEIMAAMPDNSIDLIATDPPYYRVKNEAWDRQWDTADGFIAWIGLLCAEWRRILKPNGSLYVFASPKMAARVEVEIGRWFNVLNRITWAKPAFSTKAEMNTKKAQRSYFPSSEAIIFAEHYGADNMAKGEAGYVAKCDELRGFIFEPLRAYLDGERRRAVVNYDQVRQAVGCAPKSGLPRHWFTTSQWMLPTAANYAAMQRLFNANGGDYLRREYEDLRREYEDLRRPFTVTADVPYTDVWSFPTVGAYVGKHPCEKPLDMMRHIVEASSRPGATVLDCFCGTGATGVACKGLGRKFIGVELEPKYFDIACKRISDELKKERFALPLKKKRKEQKLL